MNKGTSGALALILLWVAFASFFVAFHPGGIRDQMFINKDNPSGQASNPRDVLIWLIKRAIQGPADTGSQQSSDTQTQTQTQAV